MLGDSSNTSIPSVRSYLAADQKESFRKFLKFSLNVHLLLLVAHSFSLPYPFSCIPVSLSVAVRSQLERPHSECHSEPQPN